VNAVEAAAFLSHQQHIGNVGSAAGAVAQDTCQLAGQGCAASRVLLLLLLLQVPA
jgi:hypothetical protein